MQLLWGIAHFLDVGSKRMHRRLGVTGPQRLAVRIIGRQRGISAGELASTLHLHAGTVTGIVSRLIAGGYVRRHHDATDGRRWHLHLTPKGRRLNATKTGTVEARVLKALRRTRPAQVAALRESLRILREELERAS